MRTVALAALLLILPGLAGCVGSFGASGPGATTRDAAPDLAGAVEELKTSMRADHEHRDPMLHDEAWGLEVVGYSGLVGHELAPGSYTEIDQMGDHALMVTKLPVGGFVVADVSDPADPKVLSWYKAGDMYAPDVKFGPRSDYAFLATHDVDQDTQDLFELQTYQSPIPLGVHAVDITDKENPQWSSYMHCGTSGVHNVNVADIGGTTWVFGACYDSFVNRVVIGQFDEATGLLVRVNEFSLGDHVEGNVGSVHDMVVSQDPVDDIPVLTVSYGNEGIVWVDVSDPTAPEVLGQWRWEGSDHVTGDHPRFLHYAELAPMTHHDRRITVAAPEYGSHDHTGQFWFVDVTDWDAPKLLSTWEVDEAIGFDADDEDPSSLYRYSPHNFKLHHGVLYLVHNHAGVWAVDFASTAERLTDPETLGFYAGAHDPGHDVPIDSAPDFWGIDVDERYLYVSGRGTGLYVLDASAVAGHAGHDHDHGDMAMT